MIRRERRRSVPASNRSCGRFAKAARLDIYFGATTTASGSVDPEFYAYINGALVIGPSSAPYFGFATTGFLQISDQGIAATFNLTLSGSQVLAAAGITLGNDQFELSLNTTGQDVSFTPPSITNANRHDLRHRRLCPGRGGPGFPVHGCGLGRGQRQPGARLGHLHHRRLVQHHPGPGAGHRVLPRQQVRPLASAGAPPVTPSPPGSR